MADDDKENRVSAGILFGDLKGSTEEAELDERLTVEKLREYQRVVSETAQTRPDFYKVKFEGDGFMATFASPFDMVKCGFAVQEEFRRRGWQVRLGGHFGEVYRDASGDSFGADINRAARIQAAADASRGQFLVSDAVAVIIRSRLPQIHFAPHKPIEAKGVAEPLVVFEVLPASAALTVTAEPPPAPVQSKPAPPPSRQPTAEPRRRQPPNWGVAVMAGVVVGIVAATLATAAFFYAHSQSRRKDARVPTHVQESRVNTEPPRAETKGPMGMIAVLEFENQRNDDSKNDWFCKALQTAFTTELSKIPQLPVLAPEMIQQTAKTAGVDPMTAAQRLGATRFVTGSFAVMSNTLRIDARIAGGALQEAAETVEGDQGEFFALQKKLALATMEHFRVQLTAAQADSINKPTNTRLDKYRMLLGAEGVTGSAAPPAGEPKARGPGDDPVAWQWSWISAAYAQAPAADTEAAVLKVLDQYRQAHEAGDINRLASLYVAFPPDQRASLDAYLRGVKQLRVELADVKIQPRDHDVVVSYTRRDNFIDNETGEPVSLEVRITKFLVPSGDTWKFAEGG